MGQKKVDDEILDDVMTEVVLDSAKVRWCPNA
jgi:hypothetical protein